MATSACPACGGASHPWTEKAGRRVERCARCRLLWVPDGLVVTESGASIYEGDAPVFFEGGNERYYLDETNFRSCEEKLAFVARFVPRGARLLDAGANFGHFLKVAARRYQGEGIELSAAAVRWSREKLGVANRAGSIYDLPAETREAFDAVTLWDVIEHVPDPLGAIESLARAIKPGGYLLLSTPDAGSLAARALGKHWHYLDPVQHIVLFDRANLARILERAGFEVLKTTAFGHYYRLGYVFDRLAYLHQGDALGPVFRALDKAAGPLGRAQLYITLRDVMGLAARKVAR